MAGVIFTVFAIYDPPFRLAGVYSQVEPIITVTISLDQSGALCVWKVDG